VPPCICSRDAGSRPATLRDGHQPARAPPATKDHAEPAAAVQTLRSTVEGGRRVDGNSHEHNKGSTVPMADATLLLSLPASGPSRSEQGAPGRRPNSQPVAHGFQLGLTSKPEATGGVALQRQCRCSEWRFPRRSCCPALATNDERWLDAPVPSTRSIRREPNLGPTAPYLALRAGSRRRRLQCSDSSMRPCLLAGPSCCARVRSRLRRRCAPVERSASRRRRSPQATIRQDRRVVADCAGSCRSITALPAPPRAVQ
jgi:hypothetical protein